MADSALERLVEKQNKIWARMQELQTRSESEQGWSDEDRSNWDEAEKDLTTVSADIERFQRSAKLERIDYTQVPETRAPGDALETPEQASETRAKQYEEAFSSYMRGGMEPLTTEQRGLLMQNMVSGTEMRAQGIASGAVGGYLVPPGFRAVLQENLKAYGGLINYANVITTDTGQPLQWPTVDETGNIGQILAENTAMSQGAVTFGTRTLGAYVYTSNLVLVSLQLLQDSAFDLNTWLPRALGTRIGRAVAAHLITGTGTGQPTGIVPNVTVGKTGTTGQTLTITYDDLIDLEHSVDPAYRVPMRQGYGDLQGMDNDRQSAMFVLNDSMLKVIRKLKDSQLRPLWVPVPAPGFPPTINGWPYVIDQGMPAPGANNKTVLFGDINAGYIVRQVQGIQMVRLTERYADFLQVGFFGFSRLDAAPDDPNAIRAYQHSAT
jgi:HK97 family phage major capsid protein